MDEYRQDLREKIAQGMQSLREGRVTDGEAFMAKMNAELVELQRQEQVTRQAAEADPHT
jgi:hypothetical protein